MKAMVLFSGGIDSTTCLGMAVDKYGAENVIALSISYGQKHTKETFILTLQKYSSIATVLFYHILIRRYLRNHMMHRLRIPMESRYLHMFRSGTVCFYQVLPA